MDAHLADTARCFGCRNRVGFDGLVITDEGLALCRRRCAGRRQELVVPHSLCAIELVG